jgi:hypothetical protein
MRDMPRAMKALIETYELTHALEHAQLPDNDDDFLTEVPPRPPPVLALPAPDGWEPPPSVVEPDDDAIEEVAPRQSQRRIAPESAPERLPVTVVPVIETFVPLDVQIDAFQLSRARIMLAPDIDTLKEAVAELLRYSRATKFEMRAFNIAIGLATHYYVPLEAGGRFPQIPHCAVPAPDRDEEFAKFIVEADEITRAMIYRVAAECLVEQLDPELAEFKPKAIVAPDKETFKRMYELLEEVCQRYPDKPAANLEGRTVALLDGHQDVLHGAAQNIGWRVELGHLHEVDGTMQLFPCTLADLFIDC